MVLTGLLEEHGLGREWWKTAAHMTEPRVREGTSMSGGHLTWVTFVAVRCVCVFFLQGMEMSRIFHSCPFAWLGLR